MQLKEFSLISPSVEAKEVFQALKIAIAPEAINQALETSNSFEKRQRKLPSSLVVCDRDCNEFVVIRFDGNCTNESS